MVATVAEIDGVELETDGDATTVGNPDVVSPLSCSSGYSSYCSTFDD